MARRQVDAISLVGLFQRVSARATTDCGGRPIEEIGAWPVTRAVLEILADELRALLSGAPPAASSAHRGATEEASTDT